MKVLVLSMMVIFSQTLMAGPLEEANKKVVVDFFELAINQKKPLEATKKYIGDKYIQHNPHAANGAAAFVSYFEAKFKKKPNYKIIIKRVIAEGDFVVVHSNGKDNDKDSGLAIVDIMRLEKGKIVEHFDVVQMVPTFSPNGNTMFEGTKSN